MATHNDALELPVLRLGMVGFAPAQQAFLEAALTNPNSAMSWHATKLSHADAWCANGSALEVMSDGSLQIGSAAAGTRPIRINIDDAERPIAFSLPLSTQQLNNPTTFHINSPASIRAMLDRFEGWLRPMTVQLCLASYVGEHNLDLNAGVFHVTGKGRLLAVVSRSGVGVLPIAGPADVADASWAHRPPFADEIPRHFLRIGFPQLMWQYAMRTSRDVLPTRFRTGLIYWRGPPQLPNRLLLDAHLVIARELSRNPTTFGDLGEQTRLPEPQLARCLAAFYVAGAITTDRRRAATADRKVALASLRESVAPTSAPPTDDPQHRARFVSDATAPAPLNRESL